ncbi:amidohydrolase family protein [Nocardia takedensis]|uniref:amidohydrolase family protein n=1 Tax=Nocardia takedensis TaxID=259390 RepID=UPI0002F70313|nr:amidohydrolase family protein [Nocardia takedensis]
MNIVVRDAEIDGRPGLDLRVRAGFVDEIGPSLRLDGAEEVIDARGGALIPGLHDHHLHLHATAADAASVRCGPPSVRDRASLAAALEAAPGDAHGWVRGVGYIETVAGDLDAAALDVLHARRPVRIQHRSGALWVLNSAAAAAAGIDRATHAGIERDDAGRATGRIWRADTWLRTRLPPADPPDLRALGTTMARYGITAVTDATPDLDARAYTALVAAAADGVVPQRVRLLGVPLEHTAAPATPRIAVGPYKIVVADSGFPDFDDLVARFAHAHDRGRAVAVHCVSREALLLTLAALDVAGGRPGDRIEHGALIPADTIATLRRRGLTVVTQPGFLADRGDHYRDQVAPDDLPDLYRCRSLTDAGVGLALSSDAPYGPLDPWAVIAAAIGRETATGEIVNEAERLTPTDALARYLAPTGNPGGPPRRLGLGAPADLVLLHEPLHRILRAPNADAVRRTFFGGDPPATT